MFFCTTANFGTNMKKTKKFLLSGSLLAVTSILIRFVSVSFNVYITNKIGSAGIGLITLINSVYGFAVTFATSGINLSATRMCAEAMGRGSDMELRKAMKHCVRYALFFGSLAMILLMLLARPIGIYLLNEERTIKSLLFLAPALPCIAMSSAMNGYFTAVRRVYKNASAVIFEQGIKIFLTVNALTILLPKGIEYACIAVVGGSAAAEALSFVYSFIMYNLDKRKHIKREGAVPDKLSARLFGIALPVAFTAYVRSGLLTLEHMLIPIGLRKNGATADVALATYGTIHAMVFPIVLFPQAILASFNGLIIPELSEALAKKDEGHINRVVEKMMRTTVIFAGGCAILIFAFARDLGMTVYNSADAAFFIRIFSLLIPVMYLDSAVDAVLKGMGEQVYSMKVNIVDAGISALLVYLLLPFWGISGYVTIVFFCEILNTILSAMKLVKIVKVRFNVIKGFLLPVMCALGGVCFIRVIVFFVSQLQGYSVVSCVIKIGLSLIMYCILLFSTGTIKFGEITALFGSKGCVEKCCRIK